MSNMSRIIITNRNVKMTKSKDFDNAAFKRGEFDIVMRSPESVQKTLQFLSEQGYVWGGSKTSLLKDTHMKERLLESIEMEPVYITISNRVPNGILRASPYMLYTNDAVEIVFEENKNMTMSEIKRVKAKDFDWDGFSRKGFYVAMNSSQSVISTLKFLSEQGYVWSITGESLTEDNVAKERLLRNVKRELIYIICADSITKNGVAYIKHSFLYRSDDIKVIMIDFEEQPTNSKIVIANDGKTTTATLYSNGKKAGVGTAICHEDDEFNIYTGATLALLRLEKSEKEAEMTDWERFVKGEVNMRVPKKYIRSFLDRAEKDDLKFCGKMGNWYLEWLEQDGDSIIVSVNYYKIKKCMILTEILRCDRSKTVDYIPDMK